MTDQRPQLRVIEGGKQERAARQTLHPVGRHRNVENIATVRRITPDYPDLSRFDRIRIIGEDGSTVFDSDPFPPAA